MLKLQSTPLSVSKRDNIDNYISHLYEPIGDGVFMKKLLVILTLMMSVSAIAELSPKCKSMMDERIVSENEAIGLINELVASGELSVEKAQARLDDQLYLAKATAEVCSVIRLVKAQNSVRGKLGLTSLKRADRLAEQSFMEAMEYYEGSK